MVRIITIILTILQKIIILGKLIIMPTTMDKIGHKSTKEDNTSNRSNYTTIIVYANMKAIICNNTYAKTTR